MTASIFAYSVEILSQILAFSFSKFFCFFLSLSILEEHNQDIISLVAIDAWVSSVSDSKYYSLKNT